MTRKLRLQSFRAVASLAVALSTVPLAAQKFEGLALTPPMGWNSWNTFETQVSEQLVKEVAEALIRSGMRDAGYVYINLDDGWMLRSRDEGGNLVPDPQKFPGGMKALADHLHSLGFKIGLYNCAGSETCAGYPGSQGHEFQDARAYADWGIDYLKYDWCNHGTRDAVEAYTTMSRALREAGRPMVFSICEWGQNKPWLWARDVGHLWRTSGDIIDCHDCTERWSSGWKRILDLQMSQEDGHEGLEKYAGPDAWNDPDMLEVGNPGLSVAESRAHFSLWCMLAAPLIAGNDVRVMSEDIRAILTNAEAIAIDQDPLGRQGWRYYQDDEREIWVRELSGGDWALCVLNASDEECSTSVEFAAVRVLKGDFLIRDVWAQADLGSTREVAKVERVLQPHDVILLRLKKAVR